MDTQLSPIESEFATTDQASAYESWLCAKVRNSLNDRRPAIPHDEVMSEMEAIIDAAEHKLAGERG